MKRTALFFCFLMFIAYSGFSQTLMHFYSDFSDQSIYTDREFLIEIDNMGNTINSVQYWANPFIFNGVSFPVESGCEASVLIKRDSNGEIVWAKSIIGGGITAIYRLYVDDLDNIYVLGTTGDDVITQFSFGDYTTDLDTGQYAFFAKVLPSGEIEWCKIINQGVQSGPNSNDYSITGNGLNNILFAIPVMGVGEIQLGDFNLIFDEFGILYASIDDTGGYNFANKITCSSVANSAEFVMDDDEGAYFMIKSAAHTYYPQYGTLGDYGINIFYGRCNNSGVVQWVDWKNIAFGESKPKIMYNEGRVFLASTFTDEITIGSTTLTTDSISIFMAEIDSIGNVLWVNKYGENYSSLYEATYSETDFYLVGFTDPSTESNLFNGYTLSYSEYTGSLEKYYFMLKVDMDGNVNSGITFNANGSWHSVVWDVAYHNNKIYLTGEKLGGIAFNNIEMDGDGNYIAIFSDNANLIQGSAFFDFNQNNIFDSGDEYFQGASTLSNGSITFGTYLNGEFYLGADQGNYTLSINNLPEHYTINAETHFASFPELNGLVDYDNDFIFQPIPNQNDLEVEITTGANRPGFEGQAFISIKNIGTTYKSGQLSFAIDYPLLEIQSCTPSAMSFGMYSAEFQYDLDLNEECYYVVDYLINPTAQPADQIVFNAIAPDPLDVNQENNADTLIAEITSSYDPNSKEVFPNTEIHPEFILEEEELEYIIHFQNTGNDTAFTVILVDTLSNKLDKSTFRVVSSSHDVTTNLYDNNLWFRYNQIKLVDSVTNEPGSHGYVKYRIKPKSDLLVGDSILNTAYIYFDYNDPVATNTTSVKLFEPTEIELQESDEFVDVFPNPNNTGAALVKTKGTVEKITVVNIRGQLMSISYFDTEEGVQLNTSGLSPGAYLVKVETDIQSSISRLVIE